jgi:hypothetical protein
MSMFKKLFGKSEEKLAAEQTPVACPHTVLLPRWDTIDDMGKQDRISGYTCQACGEAFTAAEGQALQLKEGDRLRADLVGEKPQT